MTTPSSPVAPARLIIHVPLRDLMQSLLVASEYDAKGSLIAATLPLNGPMLDLRGITLDTCCPGCGESVPWFAPNVFPDRMSLTTLQAFPSQQLDIPGVVRLHMDGLVNIPVGPWQGRPYSGGPWPDPVPHGVRVLLTPEGTPGHTMGDTIKNVITLDLLPLGQDTELTATCSHVAAKNYFEHLVTDITARYPVVRWLSRPEARPQEQLPPIDFLINTPLEYLRTWFEVHTTEGTFQPFTAANYRVDIQQAREAWPQPSAGVRLQIVGTFTDVDDNLGFGIIDVTLFPLGPDKTKGTATCSSPVLQPYFHWLLATLGEDYPESGLSTARQPKSSTLDATAQKQPAHEPLAVAAGGRPKGSTEYFLDRAHFKDVVKHALKTIRTSRLRPTTDRVVEHIARCSECVGSIGMTRSANSLGERQLRRIWKSYGYPDWAHVVQDLDAP